MSRRQADPGRDRRVLVCGSVALRVTQPIRPLQIGVPVAKGCVYANSRNGGDQRHDAGALRDAGRGPSDVGGRPRRVHILDVRTFPEYVFGGHPEMAHNIPPVFPKFDPEGPTMPGRPPGCTGEPNPDFVATAKESSALPIRSSSCAPRADVGRWPSTHSPTPG